MRVVKVSNCSVKHILAEGAEGAALALMKDGKLAAVLYGGKHGGSAEAVEKLLAGKGEKVFVVVSVGKARLASSAPSMGVVVDPVRRIYTTFGPGHEHADVKSALETMAARECRAVVTVDTQGVAGTVDVDFRGADGGERCTAKA